MCASPSAKPFCATIRSARSLAGDTGSSERGSSLCEILGQFLDLKRRFPSGVGYRFHALSRFGLRVERS
jgi:hypothetical protein